MRVPIFPLEAVLFPGGTSVLQIFEPRYLQMVKDCMREESGFGICLIDHATKEHEEPSIFNVGTYATIFDFDRLDNGLLGLHCRGNDRFRVTYDGTDDNNLHYGNIEWWPDSQCPEQPAVMRPCVEYLLKIMSRHGVSMNEDGVDEEDLADPNWVSYRLAEILPLTNHSKQTILEMDDATLRLKTLYAVVQTLDQGTRVS